MNSISAQSQIVTTAVHYLLTVPVALGGASLIGFLNSEPMKQLIPREKSRTGLQVAVSLLSNVVLMWLLMTAKSR